MELLKTRHSGPVDEQKTKESLCGRERFAEKFGFFKLFWIFFIGCFLGVVVETLWCLFTRGHLESRQGLIYGPFNLVYGFGALFMTLGLHWAQGKKDWVIVAGGFLIGSIYEYGCSWVQELMFGTVSWQYDQMPFNLNGRINVLYSVFWGILALFWVREIYPLMCRLIRRIPHSIGTRLTYALLVFMIFNTLISAAAVNRMTERHNNMAPSNRVEQFFDRHYTDERLVKIYPNMVYVKQPGEKKEVVWGPAPVPA